MPSEVDKELARLVGVELQPDRTLLVSVTPTQQPEDESHPGTTQDQFTPAPTPSIAPIYSQKVAAYCRVSILGLLNGQLMIDQFDGVNGYHIRTIPAYLRYQNPVRMTTGAGIMAVVDRFGDRDVVKLTNPKTNAPANAFDSQSLPDLTYPWGSIQDSMDLDLFVAMKESGLGNPRVQEMAITPRGYLVLLCTNPTCVISALIGLNSAGGSTATGAPLLTYSEFRAFAMPSPFADVTWSGQPTAYAEQNFDQSYYVVCPVVTGDRSIDTNPNATGQEGPDNSLDDWYNNSALLWVNFLDQTVDYSMPGPRVGPGGRVMGGAVCGETTTIMTSEDGDTDPRDASSIIRNQFLAKSYIGCGATGPYATPDPQETAISTTFTSLDGVKQAGMDTLNRGPYGDNYAPTEESFGTPSAGRTLPNGSTTYTMNVGLTGFSILGLNSTMYGNGMPNIPAKILNPTPIGSRIRRVHALENSLVYSHHQPDTGGQVPDPTKPLYTMVHGTHFDYLSDGGYVYGCNVSYGGSLAAGADTLATDLMQPWDISVDRSTENGSLKSPPDLKVALIDMKTGLYLPLPVMKSLGYNLIGGTSAGLVGVTLATTTDSKGNVTSGYTPVLPTACTVVYWQENAATDGIYATIGSLVDANYQYTSALSTLNQLYTTVDAVRRAGWLQLVDGFYAVVTPPHSSPETLPIYADIPAGSSIEPIFSGSPPVQDMVAQLSNLQLPVTTPWAIYEPAVVPSGSVRVVPTQWEYTSFGIIGQSTNNSEDGGGGSSTYSPNWLPAATFLKKPVSLAYAGSTFLAPFKDPAQPFNQPNSTVINGLSATLTRGPTVFEVAADAGFFHLNWMQEQVNTVVGGQTEISFDTPASTWDSVIGPIDTTPAGASIESVENTTTSEYLGVISGIGSGTNSLLRRGVGFDTNIRSWLGIFGLLTRNPPAGGLSDGVAAWNQPASYINGLGVNAGLSEYIPVSYSLACGTKGTGAPDDGAYRGSSYDYGDEATGGATGQWEFDVFVTFEEGVNTPFSDNPKSSAFPMTVVTFQEQIDNQCPSDYATIFDGLFNTPGGSPGDTIAGIGDIDTDDATDLGQYSFTESFVAYSSELIKSVTVRCRLVNYAFLVYRVGYNTLNYTRPDTINFQEWCPSADPGFFVAANCAAICCGNVMCISQVLFGNKLFATDPTYPRKVSTLWEGEASYVFTEDPYRDAGLAMGRLLYLSLEMNILAPMSNWNINLRTASVE